MSEKVRPSSKVSPPAGRGLGDFPQRTAPNPSQKNGMTPPKDPPSLRDIGDPAPFHPDPKGINR
jgi:hypothetical protein